MGSFHERCPGSIAPDFTTPPTKYSWDQDAWGKWRDSWTRLVDVQVVGPYVVTHTVKGVGTPGWMDVYSSKGERLAGCIQAKGWPVASVGDLLLLVRREDAEEKARFHYWIYRAAEPSERDGGRKDSESTLPIVSLKGADHRSYGLGELLKDTTLVVLLHPDVCEACMQERSQWVELFERHCDGLQMIGVVFGVADLEELGAFEEYLGLPFPLFWDEKEVLRRAYAEDPEAALPYKLLVAQDGTVLERWNRDRGLRGAGEDR